MTNVSPFSDLKEKAIYQKYIHDILKSESGGEVLYRFVANLSSNIYRALINALIDKIISIDDLIQLHASDEAVTEHITTALSTLKLDGAKPRFINNFEYLISEFDLRERILEARSKNESKVSLSRYAAYYKLIRQTPIDIIFESREAFRDNVNGIVLSQIRSKLNLISGVPLKTYFEPSSVVSGISVSAIKTSIATCYENIFGPILDYLSEDNLFGLFYFEKHHSLPCVLQSASLETLYNFQWPERDILSFIYVISSKLSEFSETSIVQGNNTYEWLFSSLSQKVPSIGIRFKLNQDLTVLQILSIVTGGGDFFTASRAILNRVSGIKQIVNTFITNQSKIGATPYVIH